MDWPPVLPNLRQELEEKYLVNLDDLSIHDPLSDRRWFGREPDPMALFHTSLLPPTTTLEVERDAATCTILRLKEVPTTDAGTTPKNSLSLLRTPCPPEEFVKGNSTNFPFWPGGFPDPIMHVNEIDMDLNFTSLLERHPKLSRGIHFDCKYANSNHSQEGLVVNISDMLNIDEELMQIFDTKDGTSISEKGTSELVAENDDSFVSQMMNNMDDFILKISEPVPVAAVVALEGAEWAVSVNVNAPVDNFNALVPCPATTYPFELDIFQKQAIIHMERHDCVFVAAHTSAGKTVVAEYAIALALKHLTRTIYTSPIKALSNQKYRDFKVRFDDVGLLTGDIQINPKASCLIMTTEILQSMLYNGSDLIRDLEWVIFDEVHYINDFNRGHVWEEVLIMLPAHVNIVLLSATVPNTLEFADWIGRIKKRKLYVISTSKRPVPLEHYLYTGTGGKSKDEKFLLVDANSKLINKGYSDALAAKKERASKSQQSTGAKHGRQHLGEKQEMNMWIGLIDHLSRKNLLPVVAFTLSKKRCDANAAQLESQDLTNQREKGEIRGFIKRCVSRLQEVDRELPQVVHMTHLLLKGIGVHHSGILPLLKEMVEMLFSRSLVKLLFATETFAMGVNMPARCVVFDSIRKHDGTAFRDLLPSEYIQMAGRAGRRGLDTIGTVIILCKTDVPEISQLHTMMLGRPAKLQSQFKLTYAMILNLLRVESLRVEDMMKRSFSESAQMRNSSKYEEELKYCTEQITGLPDLSCVICKDIELFHSLANKCIKQQRQVYQLIVSHPNVARIMSPGRVVVVSCHGFQNYLAVLLKIDAKDRSKMVAFLLTDSSSPSSEMAENAVQIVINMSAYHEKINLVKKASGHDIVEFTAADVVGITGLSVRVEAEKVIENVKKRQIPRFRDDPPGPSVQDLITELQRLYVTIEDTVKYLDLITDIGVKDMDAVSQIRSLEMLRQEAKSCACLGCPQFIEHYTQTYSKLQLHDRMSHLKFLMSEESLQLHPEYQQRVQVLQSLGYLQENNTVTMKGRVACEMGNHELMVTELVLENLFTDLKVEEVAALLSSLVFQQRNCSEPELTPRLQISVKQFQNVALRIGNVQKECNMIEPVADYVEQFNFGLAEVVYNWAKGTEFCNIMKQTDVQEGVTVKCIQRLDETLKDVRNAARIIGSPDLYKKMEEASAAIKRDIVFAASLYTQ